MAITYGMCTYILRDLSTFAPKIYEIGKIFCFLRNV